MMNNIIKINQNLIKLKVFEDFIKKNVKNLIFVCVGNFNVWYDSFGPIVGSILKNKYKLPVFIYGTIEDNIKLNNISNYIDWILCKHKNSKIVVIDAASSENYNDYKGIIFTEGKTKCAYFDKGVEAFGDFSVLCPVCDIDSNIECGYKNIVNNAIILSKIISNIYYKMYK